MGEGRQQSSSEGQPSGTLDLHEDEVFILVKAAPRQSDKYGETVCCAGLDRAGHWVRLYPVSFRDLATDQKFRRWDRVRYRWSRPKASQDVRSESRRVDAKSIEVVGQLRPQDRRRVLSRSCVTSLSREYAEGRSLALLKPKILDFWHEPKTAEAVAEEQAVRDRLSAQGDFFTTETKATPNRVCPFDFKYRYEDDDGPHVGTCQDWETEQTFFARLRDGYSEAGALEWMVDMFGCQYPQRGMALAMGTHRYRATQWLINGVIRVDHEPQADLFV